MLVFISWIILTGLVAAAAEARGRGFIAWFIVALFLSPVLGILLLLLFPNLKHDRLLEAAIAQRQRPPPPKASFLGRSDRVTIDRTPRPFEPDGVYAGVPYKVKADGSIEAIMQGAVVRFRDFEKFTGSIGGT
ncbi:hypothetical protein [Bradyrhizobium sp. ARR65]|uniref:hypothetical protein n=1 Tax=Bradyrhizobium sp. ARR65 TaxID=1040989 RepID=UPI000A56A6F5|nr:hypothetical protein [Bradyrhizobium sp. ARR65]